MPTTSSRRRSGSKSARRLTKETMKGRSRLPWLFLTFLGVAIPASLALLLAWNAVSLKNEHQVALACGAITIGAFLLCWAMALHERRCCCTSKMICSWILFSIILVLCVFILCVEFTDAWASDITTEKRDHWASIGFGLAGTLVLVSFMLNWFYLCQCLGNKKKSQRRKRSDKKDSRRRRRGSRKLNGSRRSLSSRSQPKRRRRCYSSRKRSQSASAVVARVSYDTRAGSKKDSHIVEMNSGWLDRASSTRRSRRSARPLRLHSMSRRDTR